jgi:hypothetical protein
MSRLRQIADNSGYDAERIAEKQRSQKKTSASMLRASGSICSSAGSSIRPRSPAAPSLTPAASPLSLSRPKRPSRRSRKTSRRLRRLSLDAELQAYFPQFDSSSSESSSSPSSAGSSQSRQNEQVPSSYPSISESGSSSSSSSSIPAFTLLPLNASLLVSGSAEAAVNGLTSPDLNDVKGAGTASLGVKATATLGDKKIVDLPEIEVDAAGYLSQQNLYFDSSSAGLKSIVDVLNSFDLNLNIPLGKYIGASAIFSKGGLFGEQSAPLLNDDLQSKIDSAGTAAGAALSQYGPLFSPKLAVEGEGYSISVTLQKSLIIALAKILGPQSESEYYEGYTQAMSFASDFLVVNDFTIAVSFDRAGFNSFSVVFDGGLNGTLGAMAENLGYDNLLPALSDEQKALPMVFNLNFAIAGSLKNGKNVSVTLPSDLSSYLPLPA